MPSLGADMETGTLVEWRIKPGDQVTLTMHPLKNGNPGGSLVSVRVPDGRVLGPGATN